MIATRTYLFDSRVKLFCLPFVNTKNVAVNKSFDLFIDKLQSYLIENITSYLDFEDLKNAEEASAEWTEIFFKLWNVGQTPEGECEFNDSSSEFLAVN